MTTADDGLLEYIEAGLNAGYTWSQFQRLARAEQIMLIARFRVRRRIDALAAHWDPAKGHMRPLHE